MEKTGVNWYRADRIQYYKSEKNLTLTEANSCTCTGRVYHINSSLLPQIVGKYFDHSAYVHFISFKDTIWNSFDHKIRIIYY